MSRIRVKRGSSYAAIDDPTAQAIIDTIEQGWKPIVDRLESEAKTIWTTAQSEWPVKTGRSKAAMRYGVQFNYPNVVRSSVYIDPTSEASKYVYYIKGRQDKGRTTWIVRVREPAEKRAKDFAKDLGITFTRTMRKNVKRRRS